MKKIKANRQDLKNEILILKQMLHVIVSKFHNGYLGVDKDDTIKALRKNPRVTITASEGKFEITTYGEVTQNAITN